MVFSLFGIHWVMLQKVFELFASWQGNFSQHHNIALWVYVPHCIMWCNWHEWNSRYFGRCKHSILEIKALFGLKKWSLITQFSSPITHHSVFITHHSSLKTPHPVWHHHSFVITQYFSTICGPHTCTLCSFYFSFLFFPSTPGTQTHRTSEKNKKEEEEDEETQKPERRKEKKKKRRKI